MTIDPRYPIGRFSPPAEFTPELHAQHIAEIADTPRLVAEAVRGLDRTQLLTPYRDGGWSSAQVVHHLVDSHVNAYVRLKLALTEDNPTIRPYNESAWAELPEARDPEIETSLTLLRALHGRWTTALRQLTPADFARSMVHPERGPMTIERLMALYAWHGRHHAAHITQLRTQKGW
jgi:uncharacterized damage-inducible protein DinB